MAHSVSLSWVASLDTVDGYNVYRGPSAGQETTKVNAALVTVDTFTDSSPVLGHDFYIVKSYVGGVESPVSNEVSTVILPLPPTNVQITASA